MDREERRRRWIIRRKLKGWSANDIAAALHIDERTVYRWWRVYRKERWVGVKPKSRAPHNYWRTLKKLSS